MHSFGFKVIPADGDDSGVPVAVAGQSMVDIQKLLTDIGCYSVSRELRLQGNVPPQLKSKFDLKIGGSSGSGIGSNPSEGNKDIMDDALNNLCEMLDFLGKGLVGTWLQDNFPEKACRLAITRTVLELADHLEGYILMYGPHDDMRSFKGVNRDKLRESLIKDSQDQEGIALGIIYQDPAKKNRWRLSNGSFDVPIKFGSNIMPSDIPSFASAGPIIVTGEVCRNEGEVLEITDVNGCYSFPEVKFHRMMDSDHDLVLLNPVVAVPTYNPQKKAWNLDCEILGISVSKPSWDECAVAFHEYFMFLWDTYSDPEQELDGEEKEIRDYLLSLIPAF